MSYRYQSIPLPRCRIQRPENFAAQVRGLNPLNEDGWTCAEADSVVVQEPGHPEGVKRQLPSPSFCPVCLNRASRKCAKCKSVFYCSKECQTKHWKLCHKQACRPNPKFYSYDTNLNQFRGLSQEYFEGHEFLMIKPTEKLESIAKICETALEGCDDVFDIPGFGTNQIDATWVATEQSSSPVAARLCDRFGWTSGAYGMERMDGYRMVEDLTVYCILFDDCFQNPNMSPGLEPSYYGAGCSPALAEGRQVRGNIVIFRLMLTKRSWKVPAPMASLVMQLTDDANLQFEYELYPVCKAEVAQMLQERTRALEEGAFTRRTWRSGIRRTERQIELSKETAPTVAF